MGEFQGNGAANSAARAGDNGNLVGELAHNFIPQCLTTNGHKCTRILRIIRDRGSPCHSQSKFHLDYANAFTVDSKLAASATFNMATVLSMRFMKPLKAVPGPSSMKRVK